MDQNLNISENFNFISKLDIINFNKYKESRKKFYDLKKLILKFSDHDFPIFLDSSVLLRVYEISITGREEIKKFFKTYRARIYITNQIQSEFLINRDKVIDNFFLKDTKKLPTLFESSIIKSIEDFIEKNNFIIKDYDGVEKELKEILVKLGKIQEQVIKNSEELKEKNKDIKIKDEILELYSKFNFLEPLSDTEIGLIKNDFNLLKTKYIEFKNQTNTNNSDKEFRPAFPGMGDISLKKDNAYGDFIIYHEMMKFSKLKQTNILFLTLDETKGDWMQKDKDPHLHYVENFYSNTDNSIFIIDSQKLFLDEFKVDLSNAISSIKFYYYIKNAESYLKVLADKYIVKKGSTAIADTPSSHNYKNLRLNLIREEKLRYNPEKELYVFIEDVVFNSPSAAASVIADNSINGRYAFLNYENDVALGEYLEL